MTNFAVSVPNWNQIPQVEVTGSATISDQLTALIPTSAGELQVQLSDKGARLKMGQRIDYEYHMLKRQPECYPLTITSSEQKTSLQGGEFTLEISHQPFAFTLTKNGQMVQSSPSDGHFVRQYRLPPLAKVDGGWFISLDLGASEAVYGLGEKWGKLDKRGQLIRSFNHDALGVNAEVSYKNAPFAWSPEGWGLFVHTPAPVTHGVGYAPWSQRSYGLFIEDTAFDLFILAESTGADMLNSYTELTGKAPTPPDWSLGVILSKAYYKDVDELIETAKAVRAHQMPCDVITLDGRAWQDTDTRFAFEWDSKRYHDPAAVIQQLKDMDFKVCVWEYPLISVQNPLFNELAEKGWLIKDKRTGEAFQYDWDMSAFGEVLTPLPKSGLLDFTHPDAYAFWRDSHKPLFDMGVDMIKADFGEQIEDDNMLAHNGEQGMALHNVYTLLYNRCVYEAASMYCKTGPFLFSRSSWIGSQCYPSQWGGDPQADWGGLSGSLRGAQSWGMTGAPYFATDIGGFYKDTRDSELFARWTQAAVFSAHMRLHGIGQREPWTYSKEAEMAANKAIKLRYKLLPYIKQTCSQASNSGLPLMRAMALSFPNEPQSWGFENQFMFGDDLLVAPVVKKGGEVQFYLPSGNWVWLENKQVFAGNQVVTMTLALDKMAVFARNNSRIPLGPDVEHTEALNQIGEIESYFPA